MLQESIAIGEIKTNSMMDKSMDVISVWNWTQTAINRKINGREKR